MPPSPPRYNREEGQPIGESPMTSQQLEIRLSTLAACRREGWLAH
jgi:hypothetical protein